MNMKRSSFTNFLFVFSVLLNIILIITIIMLLKNAPATETTYTIHESVSSISDVVSESDITAQTTTSTENTTETTTSTTKNTPKQTAKPTSAPTQATGGDNDAGWVDGWY